ncbi:activating transcription factor 7-interacting protein 2 isoform X2 [Hyperolius riggenbachi]|uniref:activating transcription factor 7-interacting protein 2 isoform X2 n=1 Tax=Hyperolius riggenbachi TaxID=752182 RepID=UPI0035A2684A
MEADGEHCSAGDNKTPVLPNANGTAKKIFRAKKTMTASCREQLAFLKMKKCLKMDTPTKKSHNPPAEMTQTTLSFEPSCTESNNTSSEDNQILGHSALHAGSEFDTEYAHEVTINEFTETCKNDDDDDDGTPVTSPLCPPEPAPDVHDTHSTTNDPQLDDIGCISSSLTVGDKDLPTSTGETVQHLEKDCSQLNIANSCPVSENTCERIEQRTIDEDRTSPATGLVTSMDVLEDNAMISSSATGLVTPMDILEENSLKTSSDTRVVTPMDILEENSLKTSSDTRVVTPMDILEENSLKTSSDTRVVTPMDILEENSLKTSSDTRVVMPMDNLEDNSLKTSSDTGLVTPMDSLEDTSGKTSSRTGLVTPIENLVDNSVKTSSATGLVTLMDVLDADSTEAAVPSCAPSDTNGSVETSTLVEPNLTANLLADSASDNPTEDRNSTFGDRQRKRPYSGNDIPESKRAKTLNKSILDQISNIIERRIQSVFKESFDQRMHDLSQQINLIQSKGDLNTIARDLKRIRRMGRRLKTALQAHNEVVATQQSKLTSARSTSREVPKTNATVISSGNSAAAQTKVSITKPITHNKKASYTKNISHTETSHTETSHSKNVSTQNVKNPRESFVVVSDDESEQQSNPAQVEKEHPKSLPKKVDTEGGKSNPPVPCRGELHGNPIAAIRKIMQSIKENRDRLLSSRAETSAKNIIDLTDDDEEQKCSKDLKVEERCPSPHPTVSPSPLPAPQQVTKDRSHETVSKEKEVVSVNSKNEHSYVPKTTPSASSTPEPVVLTSPNLLKPPQKPELRLAQVQNPKGIALSWNITHVDTSCAPAKAYCLYVHQENPNSPKKLWKKIGEIKALPLPMACTLTQFVDDATYSFALRAKDASGRFGPLCDIQSTTLKPLNTSKKV